MEAGIVILWKKCLDNTHISIRRVLFLKNLLDASLEKFHEYSSMNKDWIRPLHWKVFDEVFIKNGDYWTRFSVLNKNFLLKFLHILPAKDQHGNAERMRWQIRMNSTNRSDYGRVSIIFRQNCRHSLAMSLAVSRWDSKRIIERRIGFLNFLNWLDALPHPYTRVNIANIANIVDKHWLLISFDIITDDDRRRGIIDLHTMIYRVLML